MKMEGCINLKTDGDPTTLRSHQTHCSRPQGQTAAWQIGDTNTIGHLVAKSDTC